MNLQKPKSLVREAPSAKTRKHFASQPWCQALYNNPSLEPFKTISKLSDSSTFIADTLSSPDTIAAWQSFYRSEKSSETGEFLYLMSLGAGVNGHKNTAHGGFVAVLLDEVIGATVENHCPPGKTVMTATAAIDYKKRLKTPGVVLCRGWIERKHGRKIYAKGSIEDGEGIIATGSELFLMIDKASFESKL